MGISVEFSHHEGGPGQQEIDLRYADALTMADNIMTFRYVVKEVAITRACSASFMPKPFSGHPGSAMHTHFSLFEGDRNAFHDADDPYALSETGRAFVAGVLRHAQEITAVTNQWVNSYKRLIVGGEAPDGHLLGARQPLRAGPRADVLAGQVVDAPGGDPHAWTRACNPYLAFAVILGAGLQGVAKGYELAPATEDDVWSLTETERKRDGLRVAAAEPHRGAGRDGALRAGRRDPRRARVRLLPAQQARRSGTATGARSRPTSWRPTCPCSETPVGGDLVTAHGRRQPFLMSNSWLPKIELPLCDGVDGPFSSTPVRLAKIVFPPG